MDEINIDELGQVIIGAGTPTAYVEYKPERAIKEVAEKVNEIIRKLEDFAINGLK